MTATDWNRYYNKPYKTSSLTRKITGKKLVKLIKKHCPKPAHHLQIAELGGANSSFYERIENTLKPLHYKIIDNNRLGLAKFSERVGLNSAVSLDYQDILDCDDLTDNSAHLCFSVGLIEHFSIKDTARAISAHFSFIKKDGICIITFPTPTWLYRLSRKVSEHLNMWIFWDERPLSFEEVEKEITKHGDISHKSITWSIFFTQGVIVAKKR